MSSHNLQTQLVETVSQVNVGGATTKGKLFYYLDSASAPSNGLTKYSTGCLAINVQTGKLYINTGTNAATSWTLVGSQT